MINITDEYLEDEIRDGFYIPSMTKRTWAMELTVLDLIDSLCRKHNIKYFADWGTYLGAVRHGGFVPWDDDLDICMHRNEFEKFCKVANSEFPDGYSIITFKNNDYSWKFIANVAPNDHMCFEPAYLKSHYAFPYIVGIDIFIIDNINDDENIEKENYEIVKKTLNVADLIDACELTEDELCTPIARLNNEKINNAVIYAKDELSFDADVLTDKSISPIEFKRILYTKVEDILKGSNGNETEKIMQKIPWAVYHNMSYPKEYYEESTRIPFEMTTISVPKCYDRGMRVKYGNYMKIIMGAGGHDYPYYIGQKKSLNADFDYPALYKFNEGDLSPASKQFEGSLKTIAKDMTGYFKESLSVITGIIDSINNNSCEYSVEDINSFLADVQDNVIQFGTLIEKIKGEGTNIVSLLEKYCEYLFVISNAINELLINSIDGLNINNADSEAATSDNGYQNLNRVLNAFVGHSNEVISAIESEIINRRTVLFLPFKAKYWSSLEPVFKMECRGFVANSINNDDFANVCKNEQNSTNIENKIDNNCSSDKAVVDLVGTDIVVATLPYYYKEYNGAFKEPEHNEAEKIIELISKCPMEAADGVNVYIKDYTEIDLALLCPEVIYINNPYDEYNMAISVPQYFYARNLRQYTEKLIYIPFFKSMEFEKTNYPCFYNMQYYCTVPGVVLADEVWLQSENIRDRYLDKLEEWCKKELKKLDDTKKSGQGNNINDNNSNVQNNKYECDEDLAILFDNKLKVITDLIPTYYEREPFIPKGIRSFVENAKSNGSKLLVWYINGGTLFEYEDEFVEKMKRCLDIYIESKDRVKILLVYDNIIGSYMQNDAEGLSEQVQRFIETFKVENVGIVVNDYVDFKELGNMPDYTDAYYGNPSIICKDFELAKKPVMLQNVEI